MRVLITGGKSAAAMKLLRHFTEDEVILADYGDVPHVPSGTYRFLSLGALNTDTTAHALLTFCLDHGIEAVVPVCDFENAALSAAKQLFEEFNIRILPDPRHD